MHGKKGLIVILIVLTILTFSACIFAAIEPKNLVPTQMSAVIQQDFDVYEGTYVLRNGELITVASRDECLVGDIYDFYYKQGWVITFTNCGEAGGSQYATAELYATSSFTSGSIVTERKFMENGNYWATRSKETTELQGIAKKLLYTYTFTGGAEGEFKLNGETVLQLVDNGSRVYNPTDKIYYEVLDWEKGFQGTEGAIEDSEARPMGLTGQVEWSPTGEEGTWVLLQMGTKLPPNAHIKTQEDSSCMLSFSDMSTFVIKEESHIVLTMPPDYKQSKIKMVAGNVWVNVKNMLKDGSMAVEMNQATTGIKGTTFVLTEAEGKSTIKLIEGALDVTSLGDQKTTSLTGGQFIVATSTGTAEEGTFNAKAEQDAWDAFAGTELIDETLITPQNPTIPWIPYAAAAVVVLVILLIVLLRKKKT